MNFNNAEFFKSFGTSGQIDPPEKPEVVFSGRSNVGKSSLLNKILQRKNLAHTSSTPGKTITINFFRVDDCYFVDLPGYGFAKRSDKELKRFAELMEGYFAQPRRFAAVVQLVDMRRPATEDDLTMFNFLKEKNIPCIAVLTKADKLNKTEFQKNLADIKAQLEFMGEMPILPFSTLKNIGIDEVKETIINAVQRVQ